ncbi:hypothetical protein PshuTeo2_20980 [Pseudomonas hunanensis]|nr:hypothetical protein [Pseudomonas hunanensis]
MPRLKPFLDPHPPTLTAIGLLFMRVTAALLLLFIHGLPKLLDWSEELQRIEDPFGLGATLTLALWDKTKSLRLFVAESTIIPLILN